MKYIIRPSAYALWILAMVISVALAWQFHGGENKVALSIALLALGMSAFGVIFARDALQRWDWFAALCGIALWAAGAVFFTITEIGYWDSSYNRHYAEYQQVKTAKARADGINDKRWQALTTGDIPATPAQVKAQIAMAQVNERWMSTKQCTAPTTVPSREFCSSYFKLTEQLAVAEHRLAMEEQFSKGIAEKEGHIVQNLLAGAEVLARRLKITERQAADLVILAAWALLFLARDLGGVVANPLGRRQKPKDALRLPEGAEPATLATVIASVAPRANVEASEVIPGAGKNPDHVRDTTKMVACVDEPTGPLIGSFSTLETVPYASDEEIANLRRVIADMKAAGIGPKAITEEAKALTSPEIGSNSPNLDSEESDGTVPFVPAADDIGTEAARKVVSLFRDDMPKPMVAEHPFSADVKIKREKTTRGTGSAVNWADECTEVDEDAAVDTTIVDIWPSYAAWCRINNFHAMPKKELSRKLGAHLKIPPGRKNGKRTGSGKVFRGLIVHMPAEQEVRRYA